MNKKLTANEIGFSVVAAASQSKEIAAVEVDQDGGIVITPRSFGTTQITLKNKYAEKVIITVTVGADNEIKDLSYTAFEMPKNYVYASDFGMDPTVTDKNVHTKALQDAIDAMNALPDGGVVYVPKGNYYIHFIQLKENVTIRLEGVLQNYNTPYTEEIDQLIKDGTYFARLMATDFDMFANHAINAEGVTGASNFSIMGGVIDMIGRRRGLIWTCAHNVVFESVILKDTTNNHALQVTGCTNVIIRDIMCAGFNAGPNSPEVIQVESTHPGAIGMGYGAGSVFAPHEYYHSNNVLFENCYFGRSVQYDAPSVPIGHHGHQSKAPATNLRILNCTFDNPRVLAIRSYAYTDIEISGCRFISDRDNVTEENHHMIQLTFHTGDIILSENPLVYITKAENRGGCQNYRIHNNEFIIGEKSRFCGIISSPQATKFVDYEIIGYANILQTDRSTEEPSNFTGYTWVTNKASDIYIYDNKITAENALCSALYKLVGVSGLLIENNSCVNKTEMTSSMLDDKQIKGADLTDCSSVRKYAQTLRIAADSAMRYNPIVMKTSNGSINAFCAAGGNDTMCVITFECDQKGIITGEIGSDNNVYITPVADEGYVFDGYYYKGAKIDVSTFEFQKDVTVKLKFVKK